MDGAKAGQGARLGGLLIAGSALVAAVAFVLEWRFAPEALRSPSSRSSSWAPAPCCCSPCSSRSPWTVGERNPSGPPPADPRSGPGIQPDDPSGDRGRRGPRLHPDPGPELRSATPALPLVGRRNPHGVLGGRSRQLHVADSVRGPIGSQRPVAGGASLGIDRDRSGRPDGRPAACLALEILPDRFLGRGFRTGAARLRVAPAVDPDPNPSHGTGGYRGWPAVQRLRGPARLPTPFRTLWRLWAGPVRAVLLARLVRPSGPRLYQLPPGPFDGSHAGPGGQFGRSSPGRFGRDAFGGDAAAPSSRELRTPSADTHPRRALPRVRSSSERSSTPPLSTSATPAS